MCMKKIKSLDGQNILNIVEKISIIRKYHKNFEGWRKHLFVIEKAKNQFVMNVHGQRFFFD